MTTPTHLHRRSSSRWVPPSAPLHNPLSVFRSRSRQEGSRVVQPNHMFNSPRYELSNYRQFTDNSISTTKYSLLTFVPLNIFHQITTKYANMYFILIAALNWIPYFMAYTKYLGLIPITFVLGTTLVKDGVEDLRRWKFDNKINKKTCHVWDRDHGAFRKTEWRYILVGDFVHISNDEEVPADILFLRSSNESGTCFVETSNLDGESALKQRFVPAKVLHFSEENAKFKPTDFIGVVTCEKPDKSIYTIRAKVEHEPGVFDIITKENMLLRGSRVKNTTFVEGIVVYAGHDTKVMLNNGRAPHKTSGIERLTNKFIIICFLLLMAMVAVGSIASAFWVADHQPDEIPFIVWNIPKPVAEGFINVGAFIICYQILVPISLYITVEIIKAAQIYFISQDVKLYDEASDRAIDCRSLSIPEELGTITHVLSDKTGTLTENVMIFRHCAFDEADYGSTPESVEKEANYKPIKSEELSKRVLETRLNPIMKHFFANILINNSVVVNKVPHQDAIELGTFESGVYQVGNSAFFTVTEQVFQEKLRAIKQGLDDLQRPQELFLSSDSSEALSVIQEENDSPTPLSFNSPNSLSSPTKGTFSSMSSFSKRVSIVVRRSIIRPISNLLPTRSRAITFVQKQTSPYEAESPDELALIEGIAMYDYLLEERAATSVIISTPFQTRKRYGILLTLPFDATRKRMSVVVRTSRGPLLYCKGADSAIFNRLADDQNEGDSERVFSIKRKVEIYAQKGLRTLCFAMRYLTEDEFDEFELSYRFVMEDSSSEREMMLSEKADEIEKELLLLGVTGIEDRLQDGVRETLEKLREADIQIWVLTGDKLETAQNIATSCGLFHPQRAVRVIENARDAETVSEAEGCNVVLSPMALKLIHENNEQLIIALNKAKSVLCYRMTPSEKAAIVKTVKESLKGNVLAIGDGANDVPMIQAANVGIGIAGKEGLQAAMACDFAIARFRFLSRLLLVHGHWCYHRLALSFLYFLYKNANCVFILFFYQFYDGYSGTNLMDPVWGLLYPIIFSSVQPIVVGVYDQDFDDDTLDKKPGIYGYSRGRLYTTLLFFIYVLEGIYQAAVIYYVAHFTLVNTGSSIWETGFFVSNSMLFANTLHLALLTRYWTWPLLVTTLFFVFFSFAFFFAYTAVLQPGNHLIVDQKRLP